MIMTKLGCILCYPWPQKNIIENTLCTPRTDGVRMQILVHAHEHAVEYEMHVGAVQLMPRMPG